MSTTRVSIVILSHLEEYHLGGASSHYFFARFLILKYSDTNTEIDPEAEYQIFEDKHPGLA